MIKFKTLLEEDSPMSEDIWVVTSHFNENLGWLEDSEFPVVVVSKKEDFNNDSFIGVHHIPNKGSEFGSYLWFICNYWHFMPEKVAFIHGHEKSHHQSLPVLEAIRDFMHYDFHGLNGPRYSACHYFFSDINHVWFGSDFPNMWSYLGLSDVCKSPSEFVCQGGTQCLVSRDRIKSRPRSFYIHMLEKIMERDDHYKLGLVLELAWHSIFGIDPVDPSIFYFDFDKHCRDKKESILLTAPTQIWSSSMKNTVKFDHVDSDSEWISICMEALALFGK